MVLVCIAFPNKQARKADTETGLSTQEFLFNVLSRFTISCSALWIWTRMLYILQESLSFSTWLKIHTLFGIRFLIKFLILHISQMYLLHRSLYYRTWGFHSFHIALKSIHTPLNTFSHSYRFPSVAGVNFLCQKPDRKYLRLCASYGLCHNSTLPLWLKGRQRQQESQWAWLCSNKTLLTDWLTDYTKPAWDWNWCVYHSFPTPYLSGYTTLGSVYTFALSFGREMWFKNTLPFKKII